MTGDIRKALAALLPEEAILDDAILRPWFPGSNPPSAVLAPFSEDQIAQVMATASQEGWRVLPAGLCTWLGGGGAPEVDVVLSTRNLREIGNYEPADLTFSAGAGIPWADLQEATRAHGQWLPLDPPGVEVGSLGGMAALGASGPLRQAFGAPRDHVLGVTVVSGDGRILRWGGRVVKNVAGFDVTRLMLGSWGALGIITSISARLFPLPEEDVTLVCRAPDAEDLLPAARGLATSPLPLSALELLDPGPPVIPGFSRGVAGGGSPGAGVASGLVPGAPTGSPGEAALVIRLLGSKAQVREMEDRVREDLGPVQQSGGGPRGSISEVRGEGSQSFHAGLGRWEEGAGLVLRMSLLPSRLGTLLDEARELTRLVEASVKGDSPQGVERERGVEGGPVGWSETGVRRCGHVGWGVLRVAFPRLPRGPGSSRALAVAIGELRDRLEAEGGSLSLSTAPHDLIQELGGWGAQGPEVALMKGLKGEFDPAGILSPGRFGMAPHV